MFTTTHFLMLTEFHIVILAHLSLSPPSCYYYTYVSGPGWLKQWGQSLSFPLPPVLIISPLNPPGEPTVTTIITDPKLSSTQSSARTTIEYTATNMMNHTWVWESGLYRFFSLPLASGRRLWRRTQLVRGDCDWASTWNVITKCGFKRFLTMCQGWLHHVC